MTRRLAGLLVAIVVASGLVVLPAGVSEVRAAVPDLTIVTQARYEVQPAQHRVHVTLDMVLTNHLTDTRTKRYYFDRAYLSVLPGTSGFTLTRSGSGAPTPRVSKKTSTYTMLRLDLGQRIYSGKSASYRLVFDLVDAGGAATRDVRVGSSLVSFPVWAYATDATPGSTVRVVFPSGYNVEVASGDIPAATTAADGTLVFQTPKLAAPLTFFAYLVADRPAAYTERKETTTVGGVPVELTIRSWVDDKPWSERVGGLVARGMPELAKEIGLPWPRAGGLAIHEAVSRTTGGYAGLFDPSLGTIEVAYYADDFVVLHESSHAWFNGALLADRWTNEAFASYYGVEAARALKVKASGDTLTPALEASRIPLNAWGAVGREDDKTEDYAYAATLVLARAIAERAGAAGLRAVWADAAGRVGAYQPPVPAGDTAAAVGAAATDPEKVDGPPDWRGLLDLLEAHSTASLDDLWRTWVARDTDLPLLDARTAAREEYDAVLASAGDWELPRAVRDAMRAWHFDQAEMLLKDAAAILDQRATIATAAASAGLTTPTTLKTAFESPDGFASATLEVKAELEAIARYDVAVAARVTTSDTLQALGLWGSTPQAELDSARALFTAGDLTGSAAAAASAAATWSGAEDVGRGRVIGLAILVLAILLAIVLVFAWLRGRRRRRRSIVVGSALTSAGAFAVATPDPYATLAATPDPIEPVEVGDAGAGGTEPD
jgi:hypothetical protein